MRRSRWGQVFRELLKLAVENCDRHRLRGVRGPISGPSATAGQLIRRSGGRIREKLRGIHPTKQSPNGKRNLEHYLVRSPPLKHLSQFNLQPFIFCPLKIIWECGAIRKRMK